MTFSEYYSGAFRRDLHEVMTALRPLHSSHGEDPMLQPRTVSLANPAIGAMSTDRRDLFAVALAFTVLVDEVCYAHFRRHYDAFRALTLYPKYCGDCPGGCRSHLHPQRALYDVGRPDLKAGRTHSPLLILRATGEASRREVLQEARPTMEAEIVEFFSEHVPAIDGADFWHRCLAELPR